MKLDYKTGGVAALLIAGFILAGSVSAFGMHGMENGFKSFFGSSETGQQLETAIANNDYTAFTTIQKQNFPNAPLMSQDQFSKLVAQHALQQKVETDIQTGNYADWKALMTQSTNPRSQYLLTKITADNFHLLKDLEDAQQKVQDIGTQLGIQSGAMGIQSFEGRMHSPMMGMHERSHTPFATPLSSPQ